MAPKNKKKKTNGYLIPVPLVVIPIILVAVFALCDLYLKAHAEALGREIKALEARRAELREHFKKAESEWSIVRSPASVENALREHGLMMTWPRRDQIVRISCTPSSRPGRRLEPSELMPYANLQKVVMND